MTKVPPVDRQPRWLGHPERPAPSPPHADMAVELLKQTREALVGIVTVTILVLFLLAGELPMFARMSSAKKIDLQSTQTLQVINAVRIEVMTGWPSSDQHDEIGCYE